MPKTEIDYRDYFKPLAEGLRGEGLLLVTADAQGKPNPMTIGWATLGPIWGRPIFVAMVRPSRYSFELIEAKGEFTINLLPPRSASILSFCGTVSGRDRDKFAAQGLTATPGTRISVPTIEQALLSLECRVVHTNDVQPETLVPELDHSAYSRGDYHRLYYGEIVAALADLERLGC